MTGAVSHQPPRAGGRTLWLALLVSAVVHLLGGAAATQLGVAAGAGEPTRLAAWSAARAAPPLLLDWEPPPEPEAPPPPIVSNPAPEPAAIEPPPPSTPDDPLQLGLEDSEQRTRNVLGFKEPTPHSAPEMGVDQPALDPTAGSSIAGGPTPQGQPDSPAAAEPSVTPPMMEQGPPRPSVSEEIAGPMGDGPQDQPEVPAEAAGVPDVPELSPAEGPTPGKVDPAPARPEIKQGAEVTDPADGQDLASKPPETAGTPQQPAAPPPGAPDGQSPPSPAPPATTPGDTADVDPVLGTMPGERSEKEADPSAKDKPIEIVLGRPAAGQGLEIITKRPRRNPFSLVTRVVSLPSNPVVEVKFGRDGRVTSAKITRSSGVADVDGPVLAAVYTWTAKGKRLESLSVGDPQAAITVSVTILIR